MPVSFVYSIGDATCRTDDQIVLISCAMRHDMSVTGNPQIETTTMEQMCHASAVPCAFSIAEVEQNELDAAELVSHRTQSITGERGRFSSKSQQSTQLEIRQRID